MLGIPAEAEIDVMNDDNAEHYCEHSDQFDMALDLTAGRRGLAALGEVIARWVGHLLARRGRRSSRSSRLRDVNLTWYVGLDAEGTQDRRRAVERRGARRGDAQTAWSGCSG